MKVAFKLGYSDEKNEKALIVDIYIYIGGEQVTTRYQPLLTQWTI